MFNFRFILRILEARSPWLKHLFSRSWHFSLLLLVFAREIPLSVTAFSCISVYSTSTRPTRTATRWFWVKGRMAWCTLGGTWVTKCASPSRKSLRRTARMWNQHSHCFLFFLTGSQRAALFLTSMFFFPNTRYGKAFGRDDTHWPALDPQCPLGILRETDECLYFSVSLCYSIICTESSGSYCSVFWK